MCDTLCTANWHVSVRLIVELHNIPDTPVSLHVLSKHASCWPACVCIVHCYVTNKVQITCHCKFSAQDFVTYINGQLSQKQYTQQCVVIVVETNVFFGMESRLILVNQGEKTVPLDNRGLNAVYHNPWGYSEWGEAHSTERFQQQRNGREDCEDIQWDVKLHKLSLLGESLGRQGSIQTVDC